MELTKIKYMNNPKNYKNWNINIEQERELWKKYMLLSIYNNTRNMHPFQTWI